MSNAIDIKLEAKKLIDDVSTSSYMMRSNSEWRAVLTEECQVYVCGHAYLAKRFDEINYQFCSEQEAAQIVRDNLYALLRFKYFTKQSEEVDEKIKGIVQSFTTNLKTTLKKVSFNVDEDCAHIKTIPDTSVAFRNGVYDFKQNAWLIKYQKIKIDNLNSMLYIYNNEYAVLWYINIDFEPLDIDIMTTSIGDFVELMKQVTKKKQNYCFELFYNMSHTFDHEYSTKMSTHLAEIMGFSIFQSFSQHFVVLVGGGGNGKNSLFDGCLTSKVIPTPASISLETLEEDRFAIGSLENRYQNLYLETSTEDKVMTESEHLKLITGSQYQMIERKGIQKYNGLINCKIISAANDQDKLKWGDTSPGFRRRINIFEIAYSWDSDKRFLKYGDYYDTTFSDDYAEIKNDNNNTVLFVYLAMMGIKSATDGFTRKFKFTYNDWKLQYADIDINLKEKIESVNLDKILRYMKSDKIHGEECKVLFYDMSRKRLYDSITLKSLGYETYEDMKKMLEDYEESTAFFVENDVYINLKILRQIVGTLDAPTTFTQSIKKIYGIKNLVALYNNQPYVRCTFTNRRLKLLK